MRDEREALTLESLVKKLLAGERLTTAERDLLVSSDTIMAGVVQRLASAKGSKEAPAGTPPKGTSLGLAEREGAAKARRHGKAVLDREFPGLFADPV